MIRNILLFGSMSLTMISHAQITTTGLNSPPIQVYRIYNGHFERMQGTQGIEFSEGGIKILGELVITNADDVWKKEFGDIPIPTRIPCSTNVYQGIPVGPRGCGRAYMPPRPVAGGIIPLCNNAYPAEMCWFTFDPNNTPYDFSDDRWIWIFS